MNEKNCKLYKNSKKLINKIKFSNTYNVNGSGDERRISARKGYSKNLFRTKKKSENKKKDNIT